MQPPDRRSLPPQPDAPEGLLVDRTPHPCPYLPGRTAVLPTRWYKEDLSPEAFDKLLARSDRRVGRTMYRPACPECTECKAIRLPVGELRMSRSQKRAWKKNRDLVMRIGRPRIDAARVDLFNKHKLGRDLSKRRTTARHYAGWLAFTCVRTVESSFWLGDRLVGVGIIDVGNEAVSSVYFYFDPDESARSLGTFSVLAELEWAGQQRKKWYYLGLYVRDCRQLNYKARFVPHERLEAGEWVRHEEAPATP